MSELKGTLLQIIKRQLGDDTEIRFRASYFPYTEPSVEVDAKYQGKWLELGGAGMVHPEVLIKGVLTLTNTLVMPSGGELSALQPSSTTSLT